MADPGAEATIQWYEDEQARLHAETVRLAESLRFAEGTIREQDQQIARLTAERNEAREALARRAENPSFDAWSALSDSYAKLEKFVNTELTDVSEIAVRNERHMLQWKRIAVKFKRERNEAREEARELRARHMIERRRAWWLRSCLAASQTAVQHLASMRSEARND